MRAVEYIRQAEMIQSREISAQRRLDACLQKVTELESRLAELRQAIGITKSELCTAILEARNAENEEEGSGDWGRVAALQSELSGLQDELNDTSDDLEGAEKNQESAEAELEEAQEEKQNAVFEIQNAARSKANSLSAAAGISGAWASVGEGLSRKLQENLNALGRAAAILGASVDTSSAGGGAGRGGSGSRGGGGGPAVSAGAAAIAGGVGLSLAADTGRHTSAQSGGRYAGGGAAVRGGGRSSASVHSSSQRSVGAYGYAAPDPGTGRPDLTSAQSGGAVPGAARSAAADMPASPTVKAAGTRRLTSDQSSCGSAHSDQGRIAKGRAGERSASGGRAAGAVPGRSGSGTGEARSGPPASGRSGTVSSSAAGQAQTPMEALRQYMYSRNYGADDYGICSKDPEWQQLHRAAYLTAFAGTVGKADYTAYLADPGAYEYRPTGDSSLHYVRSAGIQGIRGLDDPAFWSSRSWSFQQYVDIARQIPKVRSMLREGRSAESISAGGGLAGACARAYFMNGGIRVIQVGNSVMLEDNGRHRAAAALIAGVSVPVSIAGVMEKRTPVDPLHPMSERETAASWRIVSASVTESAVEASFRYGEGGGRQIFIADAAQMMQSGRLSQVRARTLILSDAGTARMQAVRQDDENREQDIRNAMAGSGSGARAADRRPMDPSELRQLENDTDPDAGPNVHTGDWADALTAEDLRQLDASTPPETVLPRAMDSAAAQGREDRRYQLSDQEDTGGMYHPDGVRPPRELRNGEILFQVRPESARRASPYFTDEATVRSCQDEHGRLDADRLLRKLQIAPSYDEAGNLCRTYTLKAYRYWDGQPTPAGSPPKSGGAEAGEERVRERVPSER